MKKANEIIENFSSELEILMKNITEFDLIPNEVQKEFWRAYQKHQRILPTGEPFASQFEQKIVLFFTFLSENHQDIFLSDGNIIWNGFRNQIKK